MLNFFVIVFSFRLSEIALNLFIQKEKYMQFISKLFVIVLILTTSVVSAQKNRNILKLDISSPIMRTANVSFEHQTQERSSFVLGVLYQDQSDGFASSYISRVAITPEYRYYMGRYNAPEGIYLSMFARYQYMEALEETYIGYDPITYMSIYEYTKRNINTGGVGMSFGYQRIFQDKISIDVNFGTIWNSGDTRVSTSEPFIQAPNEGFRPYVGYFVRTGVAVGFLF
jgi:hypothetical protein